MSIIVSCRNCSKPLRVPDELLGTMVKCPSCMTPFLAESQGETPAAPDPGMAQQERPLEEPTSKPRDPASGLDLSLDSPEKPASTPMTPSDPPPISDRRTPTDSEPPPPPPGTDYPDVSHRLTSTPSERPPERERERSFRSDIPEPDEERGRPLRRIHDDDYDSRSYRSHKAHRGPLVLVFGILSIVFSVIGLVCCGIIICPVAIGMGLTSWILGQNDLRSIRAGEMDPQGEGMTRGGWVCGIIGTCIGVLGLICNIIAAGANIAMMGAR